MAAQLSLAGKVAIITGIRHCAKSLNPFISLFVSYSDWSKLETKVTEVVPFEKRFL